MDKYEFNLKVEQLKKLINLKDYESAMIIADSIDWRRVKDSSILSAVSEIYEKNHEYSEAKEILILAYENSSFRKRLLYKLTELAIKDNSIDEAEAYYKEFEDKANGDTRLFLLRYKLLKAMGSPIAQQIVALEQYKSKELDEKYMYELAVLYHEAGMSEKCIMLCDDIILMFGVGKYVDKAIELKTIKEGIELSDYQQNFLNKRPELQDDFLYEEESGSINTENYADIMQEEIERNLMEENSEEEKLASDRNLNEIDDEIARHMKNLESGDVELRGIETALKELTGELEEEASEILEEEYSEEPEESDISYEVEDNAEDSDVSYEVGENTEDSEITYEVGENTEDGDVSHEVEENTEDSDVSYEVGENTKDSEITYEVEENTEDGDISYDIEENNHYDSEEEKTLSDNGVTMKEDNETIEPIEEREVSTEPDVMTDDGQSNVSEHIEEKEHYSKKKSFIITGATKEEAIEFGLGLLRDRYEKTGKKSVIKITAEKLNIKGLEESLDKISGKDLVIENVADLSKRNIEIMLAIANDESIGTDFILIDSEDNISGLIKTYPELNSYIGLKKADKKEENVAVEENAVEFKKEQEESVEEDYEKTKIISKDIEEVREVLESRKKAVKEEPKKKDILPEDIDDILDIDDFAKFAGDYATEIGCSISGKSMLALYERIEIMDDEGVELTKRNAMILITNAADRAEKPGLLKRLGNMLTFTKNYDKDGKLILKEEHFIL